MGISKSANTSVRNTFLERAHYIDWTLLRFRMAFKGVSLKNKLKLLCCAILESVPNKLRKRSRWLNAKRQHIADRFASDVVVQVDGIKYVLVDSESILIVSPIFEEWMPIHLKVKSGETFLDIGAHVGRYSFQIAKKVKKSLVIAVEVHPKNYSALKKGMELNGLKNVIPLNIAAWKEKCKIRLYIGEKAGWNSLKLDQNLGHIIVQAERLDKVLTDLNVRRVDWVKVDVECAELEVLQGLEQTLVKYQPDLIVEATNSKIFPFLSELGYISMCKKHGYFVHSKKYV